MGGIRSVYRALMGVLPKTVLPECAALAGLL